VIVSRSVHTTPTSNMSGFEPPKGLPTVFDASFKGVGRAPGLEIWRIEQFKVVFKDKQDPCYSGKFHEGDAYIVLYTKHKSGSTALERHIFFWLGKDCSQDEAGVAAYKTVELDQSLGGEPVQHRETQGSETNEFIGLFKNGVQYLPGGVASGFKQVTRDSWETRLLHIKGRRNVRTMPVSVDPASMNEGDVFILDMGLRIFVWTGKDASMVEKRKALDIALAIRNDERGARATIAVAEQGKPEEADFWKAMAEASGKPKPVRINSAESGGSDDANPKNLRKTRLFKVSAESGTMKTTLIAEHEPNEPSNLTKDMLDTHDAFILDTGSPVEGLISWVGKKADPKEKLHAMSEASEFVKSNGFPASTPITKVPEGSETALFKQHFRVWPEPNALKPGAIEPRPSKVVARKFDMHEGGSREVQTMVDDGSGEVEIWRIENFEMAPWPKNMYGQFFAGDCFVILYTYLVNNKKCYIIYFWQGLDSSQDERGASALHTVHLDDKLGGDPVQVRVVQNKEPDHFHAVFKGRMIVHSGGKASGFKNVNATDTYNTGGTRLYQIRGDNELNTRAVAVAERAGSLNSGDVFFLETPRGAYVWKGALCSPAERTAGVHLAKIISSKEAVEIFEGQEPADFWDALGGKAEYAKIKDPAAVAHPARLFQASNSRGYFYVEEIFDFDQEDLIEDDVMILDCYTEVYVWIGNGANAEEKKGALEAAIEYVKKDASRSADTPICVIKQGREPPTFTSNFFAWNPDKWSEGLTFEQMKAACGGSTIAVCATKELEKFTGGRKYTFAELTSTPLPEGVDPNNRELSLNDAEFAPIFGMSRAEYSAMPKWKANNLKKKVGLY
jgi:hypothetical protein